METPVAANFTRFATVAAVEQVPASESHLVSELFSTESIAVMVAAEPAQVVVGLSLVAQVLDSGQLTDSTESQNTDSLPRVEFAT